MAKKLLHASFVTGIYFLIFSSIHSQHLGKLNRDAIQMAEEGNYDAAIKHFKKAAELDQASAIIYNNIAYTYYLQGDYKQAGEYYKSSIELNPGLIAPHQNLGEIYYKAEKYKEAIDEGETTLKLEPENQKVTQWLPDAYKKYTEQRFLAESNHLNTAIKGSRQSISDWYSIHLDYFVLAGIFLNKGGRPPDTLLLPTTTRLPMVFNLQLRSLIYVNLKASTAQLSGILNPFFFDAEETIEIIYPFRGWTFGAGIQFPRLTLRLTAPLV